MILEEQEFPQERGLAGGGKKNMKTDPKLTDCRHSRMRSLLVSAPSECPQRCCCHLDKFLVIALPVCSLWL